MKAMLYRAAVPCLTVAVLLANCRALPAQPASQASDISVQARGPIHEAFAQPSDAVVWPGPVIRKKPPDPVPEEPPDVKPPGDIVEWIPGYWAYDDDSQQFLWVSGCWRAPPQGTRWVPGYWNEVEGGWRWVHGFWAKGDRQRLPYLPKAPPDSLDNGPTTPAPDDSSLYVPGCWVWREPRYLWRPGFWQAVRPGYVWTPAYYCETPAGYVFVDGCWDYALASRGLLFAPVAFNRPLWQNSDWYYQPDYCVDLAALTSTLFVRPAWGHYCYGDYFGDGYRRAGYYPWATYGARHHDALLGYYRWANRGNPDSSRNLAAAGRGRPAFAGSPHTVRSLAEVGRSGAVRLTPVSRARVEVARGSGQLFHESGRQRAQAEGLRAGAPPHGALPSLRGPGPAAHVGHAPAVHHEVSHVGPRAAPHATHAHVRATAHAQPRAVPRMPHGVSHKAPSHPSHAAARPAPAHSRDSRRH
jgi:hypothetical protein